MTALAANSMTLAEFLDRAWKRYDGLCPDAHRIHALLQARGEKRVINDHVALRTFALPGIGRFDLARMFERWGYVKTGDLEFVEKKLLASYWIHPDESQPKVFISELMLDRCSMELQEWVRSFVGTVPTGVGPSYLLEPSWGPVRHADYERFCPQSEYAAWTAAFGVQVNHFTVSVNELRSFKSLEELNAELLAHGFTLNTAGGVVKGNPRELLEQTSTMARQVPARFVEGAREIPGCYYEFARRYPVPTTGRLFDGFVPANADKIFESTNKS